MRLRILFLALFSIALLANAQQVIMGRVIDAKSKYPIEGVYVYLNNKIVSSTSDSGTFIFNVPKISIGSQLSYTHQSYVEKLITIDKYWTKRIYKDTLFITLKLTLANYDLPEIPVYADKKPDTLFGSLVYSIEDYIIKNDRLVLLAYTQTLQKGTTLLLTDPNQKILHEYPLSIKAKKLYKDFRNDLHLLSDDAIYAIRIQSDAFYLEKENLDVFQDFTSRIIDSVGVKYYFSNYQDIYPAFDFFALTPIDSTAKLIHSVQDKFMMELYRSEYKYVPTQEKLWAMRQEQKTGIDKEIWIGARYFTQSLYYKPNYAPMVVFSDTAFIFDHHSDFLYSINTNNDTKIDSVAITYHHAIGKDKWKQPLLFDNVTHKAFAFFQNSGSYYLRNINLTTGTIDFSFKIFYRYVENIQIQDDYVYYIYRPFESLQKKFIYREKLNY